MRWVRFFLLAALLLIAQSTLAPHASLGGARPDWLLVTVVFYALHARTRDAVLAAWWLGFLADLMTVERLGFLALSYTLAALLVVSLREYLFREHALTQLVVTGGVSMILLLSWWLYRRLAYGTMDPLWIEIPRDVFWSACYTALWAPPMHAVLRRMKRLIGLGAWRVDFSTAGRGRTLHV